MLGRGIGLADAELAAIADWRSSELFNAQDRAVLDYADSVGVSNEVADDVYAALAEHFTEAQIMKLCIAASFAGLVNRVHATFNTDLDARTLASISDAPFCLIHSN